MSLFGVVEHVAGRNLDAELVQDVSAGVARRLRWCPNMTRILVVDDDPGVRTVVSDALRQDGYQVDAVGNGQQALAAFGKHRPDALVLDLQMPIMDGPTLVRTLRERTKWGAIPLVVVSGAVGAAEAGPQLGARACLTKPFDLGELLHCVERVAPLN